MTERERWIVYPLLFLALGAALRDKLVDRTTTKSIVCQQLSIVDEGSSGPQSQRTLARIGTASRPGGNSVGYLQINGDLELVDDDLAEHSPAHILVKLGRNDPPPGVPSSGYAYVNGGIAADGTINARQYIYQGIPMVPLQVLPGVPMPNVMQAMPQATPKAPTSNAPKTKSPSQPPANEAKKERNSSQPPSPAGAPATPAK